MFYSNQSDITENMNIVITHFYFLNIDISVNIKNFELKLSVCDPNITLEGSVSQNFDIGPSFYFMSKIGNFLLFS